MLSALPHVPELLRRRHRPAVLALVCLFAGGCAATGAVHRGESAEHRQDYDLAVVEYSKALRLRPDDNPTRLALDRAKVRASQEHFIRGRRLSATGKLDQALVEFELAAELNPSGGDIEDELRATRNKLRAKIAVAREGKTELQTMIDRTRDLPPPGMDLPTGVKMPASLTFRDASSRDVFMTIARFANISLIFDTAFREAPVSVDLRNASLEVAKEIAAAIRERGGGFPGVRALGLELPRAGRVQVSMNVEDWEAAALHEIVARIAFEAARRGAEIARSELVGLMPAGAATAAAGHVLGIEGFDTRHVLELRLLDDGPD